MTQKTSRFGEVRENQSETSYANGKYFEVKSFLIAV
jgi:hypothetical protein